MSIKTYQTLRLGQNASKGSKRINVYVFGYHGLTPKSQAWRSETKTRTIDGTWENRVLPEGMQLNLAMPCLGSNDRGPPTAFSTD